LFSSDSKFSYLDQEPFMTRSRASQLLLLSSQALLFGLPLSLQAAEPAREGPWILNDLTAAQAEAKKTGKPILVVFRCER
jgi:hypothetical protein